VFLFFFFFFQPVTQEQHFAQYSFPCSALILPTPSWCLFFFFSCLNQSCINSKSFIVYVSSILDNFCSFNFHLLHDDVLFSRCHFVAREIGGWYVTRVDLPKIWHCVASFWSQVKNCNALQSEILREKSCLTPCYTVKVVEGKFFVCIGSIGCPLHSVTLSHGRIRGVWQNVAFKKWFYLTSLLFITSHTHLNVTNSKWILQVRLQVRQRGFSNFQLVVE